MASPVLRPRQVGASGMALQVSQSWHFYSGLWECGSTQHWGLSVMFCVTHF